MPPFGICRWMHLSLPLMPEETAVVCNSDLSAARLPISGLCTKIKALFILLMCVNDQENCDYLASLNIYLRVPLKT